MSIINLKNIELNNIINIDNSILTIKELLNKINYNLDKKIISGMGEKRKRGLHIQRTNSLHR